MIINIKTEILKVGMFVDFTDSFIDNPFWKNRFELTSDKEINKILKAGIKNINIDTAKCKIDINDILNSNKEEKTIVELRADKQVTKEIRPGEMVTPPGVWEPEKYLPPEVVHAVKDKNVPPKERSKAIQDYSLRMMRNIMEEPTSENISATKEGINDIVDIIMNEDETCDNLTKIISHDFYTYIHSVNVGVKSVLLSKKFYGKSGAHDMHDLGAGFFLHDIGKVNIDPKIINKPGKLTEVEFEQIKRHPGESEKVLKNTKHLNETAKVIVMQHHERDDGTGYPFGFKGFDIHPYAAICCLADVYDALTGKRSYKTAKTPAEALGIMTKQMSNHFNKDMLQKFIAIFEDSGVI